MPLEIAPKPRKMPKQARAQHTVAAILEATARILEEEGLEAANTNAIAARAGISIGSLYQYFGSKDAILAQLARDTELETAEQLEQAAALTQGQPLPQQVRHLIHRAFAIAFARPQLGHVLSFHEARMSKDAVFASATDRMVKIIAQVLEQHRTDHARTDYALAARDVLAIVEGLALAAHRQGSPDVESLEERAAFAVLGYLREGKGGS